MDGVDGVDAPGAADTGASALVRVAGLAAPVAPGVTDPAGLTGPTGRSGPGPAGGPVRPRASGCTARAAVPGGTAAPGITAVPGGTDACGADGCPAVDASDCAARPDGSGPAGGEPGDGCSPGWCSGFLPPDAGRRCTGWVPLDPVDAGVPAPGAAGPTGVTGRPGAGGFPPAAPASRGRTAGATDLEAADAAPPRASPVAACVPTASARLTARPGPEVPPEAGPRAPTPNGVVRGRAGAG